MQKDNEKKAPPLKKVSPLALYDVIFVYKINNNFQLIIDFQSTFAVIMKNV